MRVKAYCSYLCFRDLDAGVHVQMFQSSGQSDETPSVQFPSKLGTHLSTHRRDKRLSRPQPARDLNPRPVVWKRDTLPPSH
ncbi:hypothetical protein TNCV_2449041 [Trichonephila clavipes]|uniref:Uncharacterized protein n=1 Tax=Trichonephila clavipes TaxID=2585209 RepID=A0A8X6VLT3_TRICX|nr:hypothetical protein TNCV_2449041 [Trichonephila clavipes]